MIDAASCAKQFSFKQSCRVVMGSEDASGRRRELLEDPQCLNMVLQERVARSHIFVFNGCFVAAGGDAIVDDVRAPSSAGWTDLGRAASCGLVECCSLLLAAGADVNCRVKNSFYDHSPLEFAIEGGHERLFAILLKAGATIPSESLHDPYFRKVDAAGGFRAYEKAHRKLLTNTFATKLPRLPIEVVSHFVSFAFHTGYY